MDWQTDKTRIIQELVPGKEITIAHMIANPDSALYRQLGFEPALGESRSAIGILSVCPGETAIIAGDIAIKAAGVNLCFMDRIAGALVISGAVSEVEAALRAVVDYIQDTLGFAVCGITRT